jgi:hypothetical protein
MPWLGDRRGQRGRARSGGVPAGDQITVPAQNRSGRASNRIRRNAVGPQVVG